ncbi:hypothetical protein CIB95_08215 [Lottiidibacillus patelloidae]|uniref:Uncharacterized protein n=1 Tax=Lottiidibacillus patelloidae TaxID=2670334 RepID=A0A263BV55_9BACI|nr:hypothetical protein [Lottiidibacillus patelloidae]OZM57432.1 hypothetical protein CIB95_08215 [Lottiidibacillus patelloidae]
MIDFNHVTEKFNTMLTYWDRMQTLSGDEGADAAELFEKTYYEYIDKLRKWYQTLHKKPTSFEQFEEMPEIEKMYEKIPGPLQINLITDLEEIFDGIEPKRFD